MITIENICAACGRQRAEPCERWYDLLEHLLTANNQDDNKKERTQ